MLVKRGKQKTRYYSYAWLVLGQGPQPLGLSLGKGQATPRHIHVYMFGLCWAKPRHVYDIYACLVGCWLLVDCCLVAGWLLVVCWLCVVCWLFVVCLACVRQSPAKPRHRHIIYLTCSGARSSQRTKAVENMCSQGKGVSDWHNSNIL